MRHKLPRALVVASSLLFGLPTVAQSDIDVSPANIAALGIETEVVRSGSAIGSASASGVVIAPPGTSHTVTVPFDAIMVEPLVLPGMNATAGQHIAILQSPDYASAFADLETQRYTAEHRSEIALRAVELGQLGLRSREEVDEARHEAESAKLNFNAVESRLSNLKAASGAGRFILVAPFDGIVTHVSAQSGEPVMSSEPLITLFEGGNYWARVELPETKSSQIAIGDSVLTDYSSNSGSVVAVDPEIDPESRSIEVFVDLPGDVMWRIGQLVTMTFFPAETSADALIVPTRSIVRIDDDVFVFVKTASGFRTVPVEIQSRSRNLATVTGNLSIGDNVAISGLAALKNIVGGG